MEVGINKLKKNYLILDQGGSSSRGIVFDHQGQTLATAQESVSTEQHHNRVEQNPEQLVGSLRRVAQAAIRQLQEGESVSACGLITQRSSLVCWHCESGKALSPVLSWQDTRASQWLAEQIAAGQLEPELIKARTGLFANAHFGASKMRWCLDHLKAVAQAAAADTLRIAPLACYLLNRLLEEQPYQIDPANASRTLLMEFMSANWDPQLLQAFAIDAVLLPTIAPSDNHFGHLKISSGEQKLSIPLRLLNGDQSAAVYALGQPRCDSAYINLGTGAFIYRVVEKPVAIERLLTSIVNWPSQGNPEWVLEGTVNGAGSALNWFAQQSFSPESENRRAGEENVWIKQALADLQSKIDYLADDIPIFLNGVGGLASPFWQPDFESRFIGDGTVETKVEAVLDSIVFLLVSNFRCLNEDNDINRLVLSGGLSQSDVLCQKLALLSPVPVHRYTVTEASARGAAFLLAGKPGEWTLPKYETFDSESVAGYDPSQAQVVYQRRYEYWLRRMDNLTKKKAWNLY